jgi:hypothetical protein
MNIWSRVSGRLCDENGELAGLFQPSLKARHKAIRETLFGRDNGARAMGADLRGALCAYTFRKSMKKAARGSNSASRVKFSLSGEPSVSIQDKVASPFFGRFYSVYGASRGGRVAAIFVWGAPNCREPPTAGLPKMT